MALDIKYPPEHWEKVFGVEVVDDDGWRGKDALDWEVPITRDDFLNRAATSTTRYPKDFFKDIARSFETFQEMDKRV